MGNGSLRRRAAELRAAAAHELGDRLDGVVVSHHRRRLRKVGWEHALDVDRLG